ncbi:restriction endonuclease subunit S [Salarchaeum sp. III]|uniref:restriction endonuclease subunit S n=1 Tax=Salarchaeum sp. III TaxID=3107927 RepID=UPI002EDA86EE
MSGGLKISDLGEGHREVQIGPKRFEMPSEWEVKTIPELCDLSTESFDPDEHSSETFEYIDIDSVSRGRIEKSKTTPIDEAPSRAKQIVHEGDTLVGKVRPYLQAFAPVTEKHDGKVCSTGFAVLSAKDEVSSEYITQAVLSKYFLDQMTNRMTGTSYPAVNKSDFENVQLFVPPLPEQRRIGEVLSTVDEQIREADEAIEETEELKRGLMQDLLVRGIGHDEYEELHLGPRKLEVPSKWQKARLENVTEIITRGKQPTYVEEGGVPVLNQSCIYWDGFYPEELKRLDSEVASGWKDKYWVKNGDVLINSTGKGTLGRALEWTNESDTHALDSHITRVHPDESVLDPTYLRFYLESNHGQKMLYAFCVAGSTGQIELSKTDLQTMPILLPPIEEQREISEAFHRVNQKLQDEQETKEDYQQLKRGLMQDLLTGKRRLETE